MNKTKRTFIAVLVLTLEMNVALGRPSRQSSTEFLRAGPERANDGNVNGHLNLDKSCTHTQLTDYPWWAVDLGSVRLVLSVDIYNRVDCKLVSHNYCPFLSTYRRYKHDYRINMFLSFMYLSYHIVLLI